MLKEKIAENLLVWESSGKGRPVQLTLAITNRCNLTCKACWKRAHDSHSGGEQAEALSEERLVSLITEARNLGVMSVEITGGGEPLLRPQTVVRIMEMVKNAGMIGWLTTNGTLFSKELISHIVEIGWDKVTFSIDGPQEQLNDFLRPPAGTFNKITAALEMFRSCKKELRSILPEITFNVVISKFNADKLTEMIELADKYDVDGVTFEPVKPYSPPCDELMIDFGQAYPQVNEQLVKAQAKAREHNIFTNIDVMRNSPELIRYSGRLAQNMPIMQTQEKISPFFKVSCYEPWFHIRVNADGTASHCCVNPDVDENINSSSLSDIWHGRTFNDFRQRILDRNYPENCNLCNANLAFFSQEISKILADKLRRQSFHIKNSDKKIKLLVTDTAPLYPPVWGGPKRIWNLYGKFNPRVFDIVYVGVSFDIHPPRNYAIKRINDNLTEILCGLPERLYPFWHKIEKRIFKNLYMDLFPYLLIYLDWQFRYILNSQRADVVVISHPWSSLAINREPYHNQVFVYDAHNCEYLLMEQILEKHFLKKAVLAQVKRIERDACLKSDVIIACSENEKECLINIYGVPPSKISIVPNGANMYPVVSVVEKRRSRSALGLKPLDKVAVFIGACYKPNIEAVEEIIKNIAPFARELKFLIAGTVNEAFRSLKIPENVIFLGPVSEDKLHQALSAADIAVNPMLHGSGINIKMLDYMAHGLPIVATECGARGIENNGKRAIFVTAIDKFSEVIRQVFNNFDLAEQMSVEAYSLARDKYDWGVLSRQCESVIYWMLGVKGQ
ncbi:MAG: glycosyltransferase [Candidatus Omnitrophota bacterium]|jgi:MoaA/NifB/PqqE/SkfB family radical SAM enzyme/glycosyltransferase involved in cell wall biosynthesis